MKINLFETADNHFLLPLTYFKHISDLRLGCSSLAEKWQAFGLETCKVGRHYLNSDQPDATVWINARVLANQKLVDEIHKLAPNSALTTNDQIIAINTNQKMKQDKHGFIQLSDIERSLINTRNYNFTLLDFAWDFISYNAQEIEADISRLPKQAWQEQAASDKTNHRLFVSKTATISTNVVLDSHAGSIWIDDDAIIEPFVVIKGPCYIGKKTIVKSHTSITNSSIHENCRSVGEISTSIQLEFSNKGHDGWFYPHYDWFKSFAKEWNFSPYLKGKGPIQHQAIAQVRAIETRTSIVRSANTGISSVIDPFGFVIEKTDQYEEDYLVVDAPILNVKQATFYQRFGDVFVTICAAFIILLCASRKLSSVQID